MGREFLLFMRRLLLSLLILGATPAVAKDWAPKLDASMPTQGDAWAIRECKDFGPSTMEVKAMNICYQENVQKTFDFERFPTIPPFTVTRERTFRIDCGEPTQYGGTAGEVAANYCGDRTLKAAPFLR